MLKEPDVELRLMLIKELVKQEAKADQQTEVLTNLLHSSFITPFDREDVYALINSLHRTIHFIARSAKRIEVYDLQHISPDLLLLGELIKESTDELLKMLLEMNGAKHPKNYSNQETILPSSSVSRTRYIAVPFNNCSKRNQTALS